MFIRLLSFFAAIEARPGLEIIKTEVLANGETITADDNVPPKREKNESNSRQAISEGFLPTEKKEHQGMIFIF